MKKLTIEDCEQIGISTVVREQKHAMFKLQPRWNRKEFYSVLSDRLECMNLFSLRKCSPLKLHFTSSAPHFGGVRYWFLCPHCRKVVGKLYRPRLADEFECRHCHCLTYASSQTHNHHIESLSKRLNIIYETRGEDALNQTVNGLLQTKRGWKLLGKVRELRKSKELARLFSPVWRHKKETYDKYAKPLL